MSVNKGNDEMNTQSQAASQASAGQAQGAASNKGEEMPRLFRMSRNNDSERNEKILTALRDAVDAMNLDPKYGINVFPLNAAKYKLRTSAVILAARRVVEGKRTAFYAVLWTETPELVNITKNMAVPLDGSPAPTQYDFHITMSDIARSKVANTQVKECLKEQYPDVERLIKACDFPILTTAAMNGKEADPATVQEILFNVFDAIDDKVARRCNQADKIAQQAIEDLSSKVVTLKTEVNPERVRDVNSVPIRADMSIVMNAKDGTVAPESSIHASIEQLSRADFYVQPCYHPQPRRDQQAMMNTMYMQPPRHPMLANTYFLPEIHITNLQPQGATNRIEDTLLALLSVTSISDNTLPILAAAFQPRKSSGPINPRNVGALAMDCPFVDPNFKPGDENNRKILDTSSQEFQTKPEALMRLISDLFAMTPIYTLHVPEASEMGYRNRVFVEAAMMNDEVGKAARAEIIAGLDNLTGGLFSKEYWQNTDKPMAELAGYRIPLGYWTDDTGTAYDTRTILETLALKNMEGATSSEISVTYADALYNPNLTSQQREMKLLQVLRQYAPGVRITGRAYVVRMEFEFLDKARQALQAAGKINIQLQSNLQQYNDERHRGLASAERFVGQFGAQFARQNVPFSHHAVDPAGFGNPGTRW